MGILIAISIILLWLTHLVYSLFFYTFSFTSVFTYIHILLQAYLFTGLFITAHDAMHGTISRKRGINNFFGRTASSLYACLSYSRLIKNHFKHHKYPGTGEDPDFSPSSQNFIKWWFLFMKRYSTILQFVLMAIIYNILKFFTAELNIIFFWVLPAVLSTFQLFFFGTYQPHKTPHTHDMLPHKARSQKKNFVWGLLSCYFFGFHFEHHHSPGTPWWKLYSIKEN
jgi:beta-carotene/zeaxanthin 4-ketolase